MAREPLEISILKQDKMRLESSFRAIRASSLPAGIREGLDDHIDKVAYALNDLLDFLREKL